MMFFVSLLMILSGLAYAAFLFWRDRKSQPEKNKESAYQKVIRHPDTRKWLQDNLVGNPIDDVRAIRQKFGLSTEDAEKLLRRNSPNKKQ